LPSPEGLLGAFIAAVLPISRQELDSCVHHGGQKAGHGSEEMGTHFSTFPSLVGLLVPCHLPSPGTGKGLIEQGVRQAWRCLRSSTWAICC